MEGLIKQVRSRFGELGSTIPPQRTASFRGEKRPQKWFRRQSSRKMSFNELGDEAEYAAAVAAAAFAITSLDPEVSDQNSDQRRIGGPQNSLTRIRSKIAETIAAMTEPAETPKNSADGQQAQDSAQDGNFDAGNAETNEMVPEKTIHPVPSIQRTPTMPRKRLTFADELPEDVKKTQSFGEEKFEGEGRIRPPRRNPYVTLSPDFGERQEDSKRRRHESAAPKPGLPSPIPPPPVPPLNIPPAVPPKMAQRVSDQESDADAWEREQMANIRERYKKLNATILEWEDKKKRKARRKLEMTENDVDKRRAKAMQKYQIEMEQIKQIADGARAQAKEKQRNDEMKAKEKANRYEELNATILEWEEKKKKKARRKLEMKESDLEKRKVKAKQLYQTEMEQIKQIADGAREQAKEKLRKEELKVKDKASRYRATGELPPPPMCLCS